MLTKFDRPIGKLYASDLAGAALGCLLALFGLELLDAPSLVLACGSVGVLSALCFGRGLAGFASRPLLVAFAVYLLLAVGNSFTPHGIPPLFVKGRIQTQNRYLLERWNSFSRVVVYKGTRRRPHYWGRSPKAPPDRELPQFLMNIDGEAGTTLGPFASEADVEYLRYDVTNVAHYLRPDGSACVIGVGAGRDVQSALLFGTPSSTASRPMGCSPSRAGTTRTISARRAAP